MIQILKSKHISARMQHGRYEAALTLTVPELSAAGRCLVVL